MINLEIYVCDICVVGSGPGGATFAGRTAQRLKNKIVMIFEKGRKVNQITDPNSILDATRYLELTENPDIELGYWTTPQEGAFGQKVKISRAGVEGGCDAHNGLVYRPPSCGVYLKYNVGLTCDVLDYHRNLTLHQVGIVQSPTIPTAIQNETIQALQALGLPYVNDTMSKGWATPGVQRTWHTMKYTNATYNERRTAFMAFVQDNDRLGKNLFVKSCIRIDQPVRIGNRVYFLSGKNLCNGKPVLVTVGDDYVAAGGAYDSVLMLESMAVGNRAALLAQGFKNRDILESPRVGILHYHIAHVILWLVNPAKEYREYLQKFETMVAVYTAKEPQTGASGAVFDILQGYVQGSGPNPGIGLTVSLPLRDYGPGSVHRNASNPTQPIIEWNLFKNATQLQHTLDMFKLARNYTRVLPGYIGEYLPGNLFPAETDEQIITYLKQTVADGSHPAATTAMCDRSDCVTDRNFKVRVLDNTYVVDTGVLPEIAGANTKAMTIILGSLASDRYVAIHS